MDKTATQWMVEPLKKYATFAGRARRKEYWWFILFAILVSLAAALIDYVVGIKFGFAGALCSLALLLPQLTVTVRRLHDHDRSGWWFLFPLLPAIPLFFFVFLVASQGKATGTPSTGAIIGLSIFAIIYFIACILLLVWFCTRGTIGENRFGPDPIGNQTA